MKIIILGASHHKTPVWVRELLAKVKLKEAALSLKVESLKELILFSTCNRFEFLFVSTKYEYDIEKIFLFLAEKTNLNLEALKDYFYLYEDEQAIKHLFQVASGLDSLVMGEPQILGQIKDAFSEALDAKAAGINISQLMHKCFRVSKKIKTETNLFCGAVSVAYAAVELLKRNLTNLTNLRVLILGAGEMAQLVALHLEGKVQEINIISRTLGSAQKLAEKVNSKYFALHELENILSDVDVIITALHTEDFILKPNNFDFLKKTDKNIYIIDLAIPRNVDGHLNSIKNITLKNIDDLQKVVEKNKNLRILESEKAKKIIEQESSNYFKINKDKSTVSFVIRTITNNAEQARNLELEKTYSKLGFSEVQKEHLEVMTKALVRRLLHVPIKSLKYLNNKKELDYIKKMLDFDK